MRSIKILDCTLRDGGHITSGVFGETAIKLIIQRLVEAKIDIIEVGFLWQDYTDKNTARYFNIADVRKYLPENRGFSSFSLMADFIDLEHLEPCDGTIEYIRLSFKRSRLEWALTTARPLIDKGYKVFINPVNCNVYGDKEYIELIEKVNGLKPFGFSIVDTFGVMRKSDLSERYYLVEHNLDKDITLGLHLHENLGLAYSLAQHFTDIAVPTRNITIDSSLLGMGRVPGNLCTEYIVDYLNNYYDKQYVTEPIFDAIDEYIQPIKDEKPWGYAIPYALSAKYDLHRTYAEYLINKRRLKTKDIQRILQLVDKKEAELFNEDYIEGLYRNYLNVTLDSTPAIQSLTKYFEDVHRDVLVLCPGSSLENHKEKIIAFVADKNPIVISVNFIPDFVKPDFVFCANIKRVDAILENIENGKLIVTSNLEQEAIKGDYVVAYNDLVYFGDVYCEDSTLMLLKLLQLAHIHASYIAGFDGGKVGQRLEFYGKDLPSASSTNSPEIVGKILHASFRDFKLDFLTPSYYGTYVIGA